MEYDKRTLFPGGKFNENAKVIFIAYTPDFLITEGGYRGKTLNESILVSDLMKVYRNKKNEIIRYVDFWDDEVNSADNLLAIGSAVNSLIGLENIHTGLTNA